MRYFKLWVVIGWLLVLLVCYFSLMPHPPKIDIKFEHLDKVEHAFSYFILMAWFAQLYHYKKSRLFYAGFFILLGIVIEILQGMGQTRFFEVADMLANATGVLMGLIVTKGNLKGLLLSFERKFFT